MKFSAFSTSVQRQRRPTDNACSSMRVVTWNINGLRACLRRRFNGKLANLLNFLEAGALSCPMPPVLTDPLKGVLVADEIMFMLWLSLKLHNASCRAMLRDKEYARATPQYTSVGYVQTSYVSKRPR